jgi:hypothetical protein
MALQQGFYSLTCVWLEDPTAWFQYPLADEVLIHSLIIVFSPKGIAQQPSIKPEHEVIADKVLRLRSIITAGNTEEAALKAQEVWNPPFQTRRPLLRFMLHCRCRSIPLLLIL